MWSLFDATQILNSIENRIILIIACFYLALINERVSYFTIGIQKICPELSAHCARNHALSMRTPDRAVVNLMLLILLRRILILLK